MHRVLIDINGFTIYTYGALLALSFFLANQFALYLARRFGYSEAKVEETVLYSILLGVAGSRLGYVVQYPAEYLANPLQILNLRQGGLTVMGGVLFTIGVLWWRLRQRQVSVKNMFDFLAGPLLVGMAFGRLGCFSHGCCHGMPTSGPLAVTYPPGHGLPVGPVYPSQLYEMGLDLMLLAWVTYQLPRLKFAGQNLYTFLFGYGLIRFLTEFTKANDVVWGPLSIYQWFCIPMMLLGGLGLLGLLGKPPVDRNIFPPEVEEPKTSKS
jgi:phosphatidylglycerol---prolipoprotein diacylglyceryl transferase